MLKQTAPRNRGALSLGLLAASLGGWAACMEGSAILYPVSPPGSGGSPAQASGGGMGSGGLPGTGGDNATGGAGAVGGGSGGESDRGGTTGSGGVPSTGGGPGSAGSSGTGSAGGSGLAGMKGTGGGNTGGAGAGGAGGGVVSTAPIQVLIWNNALSYGHAARANAIPYLKAREAADNISFDTRYAHLGPVMEGPSDTSFDASVFTDAGLDRYDVIMFLDTTGNTIDDDQKAVRRQALQDFIVKKGRGFVGTHSASDTYQNGTWPWYFDFIGTNFKGHSDADTPGTATYYQGVQHPILMAAGTPNPWNRSEEWYTFTRDPLSSTVPGIKILLGCHDRTISTDRPSAWVHEMPVAAGAPRGGRMFYTAMGHSTSAFMEKAVMDLIINAIKWAAYRLN